MTERSDQEIASEAPKSVRPSEFMRMRRPHLFSDSEFVEIRSLTRPVFEYHLDSLTSRKQEYDFEHFARKLVEKEICPNLIPQTGPTGGGDGKIDSETYPVAELISSVWYQGDADRAGKERWAFAFSAKKKWKAKVEADAKSIYETGRDYKLIYFVTNQFVKASTRKSVEERLSKMYSIPVCILDRTWLTEAVFERDRMQIAVETLGIEEYDSLHERKSGVRDFQRKSELDDLELQINDSRRYLGVRYQLVEDCLRAALIARSLELPRMDVEGRFARAHRFAIEVGDPNQMLRVAYDQAWTTFWWYDDYSNLIRWYDEVEKLAVESQYASRLERLTNLQLPLKVSLDHAQPDRAKQEFARREKLLFKHLRILSDDKRRFANALLAKTQLVFIAFRRSIENREGRRKCIADLREIIVSADLLASYPIERITNFVVEFGDVLGQEEGYDELFELVVDLKARRTSDLQTGRALLQRGYQKLRNEKNYDAIKLLGRAQQYLAIRDKGSEFCAALAGCGFAYESVGLLWAARANLLSATSRAFADWSEGDVVPPTLSYVKRLIWIELKLGRLSPALQWFEVADSIYQSVLFEDGDREAYHAERDTLDKLLGILFLKADLWELKWLNFLPDLLAAAGLWSARICLLYALGYEQILKDEKFIAEDEGLETLRKIFADALSQPDAFDIPSQIKLQRERNCSLKTVIAGCEIDVNITNNPHSFYLGETILASLESLLATCLDKGVFPRRNRLTLNLVPKPEVERLPIYVVFEGKEGYKIEVRHPNKPIDLSFDERGKFREWLWEFLIHVTVQAFLIAEPEIFIKSLAVDELAMGRALGFSEVSLSLDSILGSKPKFSLSDWKQVAGDQTYPLVRKEEWFSGLEIDISKKDGPVSSHVGREGEEFPPFDSLKHSDIHLDSMIDFPLWDEAGWVGISYFVWPDLAALPIFGIGFKNIAAGNEIFKKWQGELGSFDVEERLRISVVTGINKEHPAHYRVLVGSNPKPSSDKIEFKWTGQRIHMLEPENTQNLDRFLLRYERLQKYVFLPVHMIGDEMPTEPVWSLGIQKKDLYITEAWKVNENTLELAAITEEFEPVIPSDQDSAVILDRLRKHLKPSIT